MGPIGSWRRARAHSGKPILIGLACDATGTFADSGPADRCGSVVNTKAMESSAALPLAPSDPESLTEGARL